MITLWQAKLTDEEAHDVTDETMDNMCDELTDAFERIKERYLEK